MATARRVALLLDSSRGWDAGFIRGIARYINLHQTWQVLRPAVTSYQLFAGYRFLSASADVSLSALMKQRPEGVVMHESGLSRKLRQRGVPTIVVPTKRLKSNGFYATCDDHGVGRVAAEHLLSLGLRRFAYLGFEGTRWSQLRSESFRFTMAERRLPVDEYLAPLEASDADKPKLHRALAKWLSGLPKPVGLLAGNDDLARAVVDISQLDGISIPEEIAVVGVDNDEFICELTSPPLSSIPFAIEKAGYEAAEMLDRLMEGQPVERNQVEAAVRPIVVRSSSDYAAIDDPEVAKALAFIRENTHRLIQVRDVVNATTLSHRTLQNRFTATVGHAMVKEINRRRAQYIAGLLAETTQPIGQIALKLGYEDPAHLVRFFRREIGESPGAYRRRIT